ncbi:hypothetical protein BDY19DRAFT_16695 [Irpex rosettiformis]|uniref:Uncharacterized protein n=1 Tax=Irpex rosettiformis TaxID=378272 RepID=A0ACB8UJ75_9APHY|nr:hypothetical protein BDY19DRAFT_16695 [Irpex rosettiformis]
MKMDSGEGWQDHLHFSLLGEHVLFPSLHLDSARRLVEAAVLTVVICATERCLTYAINTSWTPFKWTQRTRLRKALWKATLYWVVTLLRLLYMLIAMTFSMWLILVTVTTLATGQFIIEYLETPDFRSLQGLEHIEEPLLKPEDTYDTSYPLHPYGVHEHANDEYPYKLSSSSGSTSSLPRARPSSSEANVDPEPPFARPRSKSKPDAIWIHPTESNIARADARAIQLGLVQGDTNFVNANQLPAEGETAWEIGRGRDVARELLGKSK